ncbi:MAG: HD domain-containing protein [Saprospiraceae bacterium]|nr:MAG: HD domain-containing protein [Saprospiraceae bacterium]
MKNYLVNNAGIYVTKLLLQGLSTDHHYHSLPHTLSVREASVEIGRRYRVSPEELEILELAALFHDTGFTRQYDNHEDFSKEIAVEFLEKEGAGKDKIEAVKEMIDVTRLGVEPQTLLQKILKDADFNTLTGDYQEKAKALRHEWEVFCQSKMTDAEWLENNIRFWESHRFYTGEGLAMFGQEKRKTLKKLKREREENFTTTLGSNNEQNELRFALSNSKSAQMMFRTTLRNQINLTNIADNKANIMLSINSLLITFGIPMLLPRVVEDPRLALPTAVLLVTCVLSIVNATMATRPVKMEGYTDLGSISKGKTNLFFFGNFFKMNQEDYRQGLKEVVRNAEILDNTIVNDLYFLGRTLGNKYRRLRITYNIFMIGMICTGLAFAFTMAFL